MTLLEENTDITSPLQNWKCLLPNSKPGFISGLKLLGAAPPSQVRRSPFSLPQHSPSTSTKLVLSTKQLNLQGLMLKGPRDRHEEKAEASLRSTTRRGAVVLSPNSSLPPEVMTLAQLLMEAAVLSLPPSKKTP